MKRALNVLAEQTHGISFNTKKFCFEDFHSPEGAVDDHKEDFTYKDYGETIETKETKDLSAEVKKWKDNKIPSYFTYFLDGSRRTYKIDDVEYSKRIYPIIAGQIIVGCCMRQNKNLKSTMMERQLVLAIPECAKTDRNDRQFKNRLKAEINNNSNLKNKFNLEINDILFYKDSSEDKYENFAIAKIQDHMVYLEKKVVADLTEKNNLLSQTSRLIKDGSLEYQNAKNSNYNYNDLSKIKNNYRWVVGVSKRFNPEICTDLRGRSNASKIAKLNYMHRTPAYKFKSERSGYVDFAVWYLRIRDAKFSPSPFDGIVKVEKILTEKESVEGIPTEEVDMISCHIINERNPVCYKADTRWANHLYPIYLTESYIKSHYISNQYLINAF